MKPLSQEGLASIREYIKDGNSVLLMVSSEGPWSNVIRSFAMQTYQIDTPDDTANASSINASPDGKDGLPIKL